ncbi:hypothetical protein AB1283_00520 [Bacillus sp. S13(2024)]|uniref:hypothetical protein n=1 Tax=Bacillus sp. S13(2024) TaxID=3162885 RepID=UPI003D21F077
MGYNQSVFPQSIDTFVTHMDISPSEVASVNRFYQLKLNANRTSDEDAELANLSSLLRNKIFTPEDFNKLQDAIVAIQIQYRDKIDSYIDSRAFSFSFKGSYADTTIYSRYNMVTYNGKVYLCLLDNTLNILPTNTTNWTLFSSTGADGAPGIGLSFIGSWDSTKAYVVNNAVEYTGSIYYCIQNNTNVVPTDTSKWKLFMSKPKELTLIDAGNYYDSPDVEGALQEIGRALSGTRTSLINSVNSILNM